MLIKKIFKGAHVSSLTLRIMAVNVAALLILVAGILFGGQYEKSLIHSEQEALLREAALFSSAIAEGGVRERLDQTAFLTDDLARQMVRRLGADNKDTPRMMLFDVMGKLVADSHQMLGAGGIVEVEEITPPFRTLSVQDKIKFTAERTLNYLPGGLELPHFPDTLSGYVQSYPHAIETLGGGTFTDAWQNGRGHILLTASVPVQKLKTVMGALLIIKKGVAIEAEIAKVRLTIVKVFLITLALTVFLSLYLSETIVWPIIRLADATDQVRVGKGDPDMIPDFSWRRDEIGRLSQALRDMTQSLSSRLREIEMFAADVAHEIKNPLASLKSALETLPRVAGDVSRQSRLMKVMDDDVKRMDRLISDISSASRLDAELGRMERKPVDINTLLLAIADIFRTRGEMDAAPIILMLPKKQKLMIEGIEGRLSQVFQNLISNALSFTPADGRIEISAAISARLITIHVDNEGGEPIPDTKLEKIFDRFYSERPASEEFGQHSGLGLSICRQIVRAHGGSIFAENLKFPDGSHRAVRFTVILPQG